MSESLRSETTLEFRISVILCDALDMHRQLPLQGQGQVEDWVDGQEEAYGGRDCCEAAADQGADGTSPAGCGCGASDRRLHSQEFRQAYFIQI